jgi:general stress protein 26
VGKISLKESKESIFKLMVESPAAYLTTIDENGFPITRAMFNLRNQEQFPEFTDFFQNQDNEYVIYISTNTASSKVTHIQNNPKISVYYCNPEEFEGTMFGGVAEIIEDREIKHAMWLDWWDRYYLKGVDDPDFTIIRLNPKHVRYYHKLQPVTFNL